MRAIALTLAALAAAPTGAAAHDNHRDWTDGVEAGGYLGGMGGLLGLAGAVTGGLLGWAITRDDDCGKPADLCLDARLAMATLGGVSGLAYGVYLGGVWYDEDARFDGSFLGAAAGVIVGSAVGGAVGNVIWEAGDGATWARATSGLIGLGGLALGAGLGYVWFGDEATGGVSLDLPAITPIAEDGYGIGLSGRF